MWTSNTMKEPINQYRHEHQVYKADAWVHGSPEERDLAYADTLRPAEHMVGIPQEPVVALVMVAGYGAEGRRFENRTPVYGGLRVISHRTPAEAATDAVLRPHSHVIEVGGYKPGEYDLVQRIYANGPIKHDGVSRVVPDKIAYIRAVLHRMGLSRAMLHMQTDELLAVAQQMGLQSRESIDIYKQMGKKTALNTTLEDFQHTHPDAVIGRFGTNFYSLQEMRAEILRLQRENVGARIKFDAFQQGQNLTGGIGQFNVDPDMSSTALDAYVEQQLRSQDYEEGPMEGVVQMLAEPNRVYSISSGERPDGRYDIYEAHIQTQDGTASDGAKPVGKNQYGAMLLGDVWAQTADLYRQNGLRGDQNMNFLVLPPHLQVKAQKLYGNPNLAAVVPIDLNPRPLSGTKTAMGRYTEETGKPIDFDNFFTRGVRVNAFYAANPQLIYYLASEHGYRAGKGGNFAITNMGKFVPEALPAQGSVGCQMFLQETANPEADLAAFEAQLAQEPDADTLAAFQARGFNMINPQDAAHRDADEYTAIIAHDTHHALELNAYK